MRKENFKNFSSNDEIYFHAILHQNLFGIALAVSNLYATIDLFSRGIVHAMQHPACHLQIFSILLSITSRKARLPLYMIAASFACLGQTWSECRGLPPPASLPPRPLAKGCILLVDPATPPKSFLALKSWDPSLQTTPLPKSSLQSRIQIQNPHYIHDFYYSLNKVDNTKGGVVGQREWVGR